MGHWSERLLDDAAAVIGPDVDRDRLLETLIRVGHEIDILSGRTFGSTERKTVTIAAQPYPFAEIPDLNTTGMELKGEAWPIADPINQQMATVLQVARLNPSPAPAIPVGDALWIAGQLVAQASRAGRLTRDFVIWWLANALEPDHRKEILKNVVDQATRFNIPLEGLGVGGWWFQITRRLFWVTNDTPDEGRLMEPLQDLNENEKAPMILVAGEPVVIVARITSHPADWALSARVWSQDVKQPSTRPWRTLARVIHGTGVPILTVDHDSSPEEIGCQLLLLAYWHGYVDKDEPGLADSIAQAYPNPVARLRAATHAPDMTSAAATLLQGLLHPGCDPAKGAQANRRYVNRKVSIAIMEHRKVESPYPLKWQELGVTERHYYKLLRRFATKISGRYQVDSAAKARIETYLSRRDQPSPRGAAIRVLRERGFTESAARKWLQRHELREAIHAWPRSAHSASSVSGP
jgi:hypothetical protein